MSSGEYLLGTKEYQRVYQKTPKARTRILAYNRKYVSDSRLVLLKHLGDKCVRCGFSDPRALQIDHINGGGRNERTKLGGIYYKKVLESIINKEGKYQLLCANCNFIKRYENNENGLRFKNIKEEGRLEEGV